MLKRIAAFFQRLPDESIPDLEPIEYRHAVVLAFRPDIPSPLSALAVGWLGKVVLSKGDVDGASMLALRDACNAQQTDIGELGSHTCGICGQFKDRGEFIVQANGRTYVLPRMVLHYIEAHRYRPPDTFLSDLLVWVATERKLSRTKGLSQ
jgi:hypothetical protein